MQLEDVDARRLVLLPARPCPLGPPRARARARRTLALCEPLRPPDDLVEDVLAALDVEALAAHLGDPCRLDEVAAVVLRRRLLARLDDATRAAAASAVPSKDVPTVLLGLVAQLDLAAGREECAEEGRQREVLVGGRDGVVVGAGERVEGARAEEGDERLKLGE